VFEAEAEEARSLIRAANDALLAGVDPRFIATNIRERVLTEQPGLEEVAVTIAMLVAEAAKISSGLFQPAAK
jgi:hypothetical protein